MGQIPLNVHYDSEMDIFSAWWRQPGEVVCTEPVEGIVLRADANTDEFVGYTIIDCRRRFAGMNPANVTLPLVPVEALRPLRAHLSVLEAALAS
jgi:hypothetical protein